MSMKKLGKKGGFNEGTLVAFACACNCNLCLCTSCNNCNTIPNATAHKKCNFKQSVQQVIRTYDSFELGSGATNSI